MYTCAACRAVACAKEHPESMPGNCPMRERDFFDTVLEEYHKPETKEFYITASEMEAIGYGQWTRLKETIELCLRMGYRRVGMAFCMGLHQEARVVDKLLRRHGLDVVSVICKTGGIPKESAGISKEGKISADGFESMCNPIAQAKLLEVQETEFNVALGLCVGHDSLFFRHSHVLATNLICKDRVLAHNPAGAVYCAEGYYKNKLNP